MLAGIVSGSLWIVLLSSVMGCSGLNVRAILDSSSIEMKVTGGYSDVRSVEYRFRSEGRAIRFEKRTTFWRADKPLVTKTSTVPETLYVGLWEAVQKNDGWRLPDASYQAEDVETYTFHISCCGKEHSFFVQSPRDQEDRRYWRIRTALIEAVKRIETRQKD